MSDIIVVSYGEIRLSRHTRVQSVQSGKVAKLDVKYLRSIYSSVPRDKGFEEKWSGFMHNEPETNPQYCALLMHLMQYA